MGLSDRNIGACQWYAQCRNDADGWVTHPTLGAVPRCQQCADKHGLTLDKAGA